MSEKDQEHQVPTINLSRRAKIVMKNLERDGVGGIFTS